ncbi:hypothetical protein AB6A40_006915 [Gnathostoma spinigerum]|uniref:Ribosomal protein L33 n=1 Tax=Gnathostoma spinigerum TaxID=75299 RepID=A0ABD6ELS3_9BILA
MVHSWNIVPLRVRSSTGMFTRIVVVRLLEGTPKQRAQKTVKMKKDDSMPPCKRNCKGIFPYSYFELKVV